MSDHPQPLYAVIHRAGQHASLRDGLRSLLRNRGLLLQFARRNLLTATRGSVLGRLWLVLTPVVTMLLYTFVFGVVFGGRYGVRPGESGVDYALGVFLSLSLFQLLSDPMNSASSVVGDHPSLVKKVVFPVEVLPVAVVVAQVLRCAVALALVLLGALLLGDGLSIWALILLWAVPTLGLLSAGLALLLAALGVFLRDLSELTRLLSTVLLFGSAVFFSVHQIPAPVRPFLQLNPLLVVIGETRGAVLWQQPPALLAVIYATAFAVLAFTVGLTAFQRLRDDFADAL